MQRLQRKSKSNRFFLTFRNMSETFAMTFEIIHFGRMKRKPRGIAKKKQPCFSFYFFFFFIYFLWYIVGTDDAKLIFRQKYNAKYKSTQIADIESLNRSGGG